MTIPAYPLQWPAVWKRIDAAERARAQFKRASRKDWQGNWTHQRALTIAKATARVHAELTRMKLSGDDVVVSTDLLLRLDGGPRSGQSEPKDPGAAVYWRDSTQDGWPMRCMAIDRYDRVADNLAAIAATLDAMRAIERHGGATILDRAFTGFTALPPPGRPEWADVLGVSDPASATRTEVDALYRTLRSQQHPDKGGSAETFGRITHAWAQARNDKGWA